ncbi:MAG: glycosyltransferase family 4 protein [Betaproteobacteria bacterium]
MVHTESSLGWGGQEIRILSEARGMAARGHSVTLVTPPQSRIYAESRKYGLEAVALPIGEKRPAGVFALRRWLKEHRPDVVNTHSSTDAWLTALSGWRRTVRTRHISAPVSGHAPNRWLYGSATRRVVTTGESLRRHLIERLRLPDAHVVSIPTGIDLARYRKSGKATLGLPDGAFVFGIVATLRSWKGHADLIDAFSQLQDPRFHLVIAGDGPQRPALEKKLTDRVHLIGHREDVPQVLEAFDIFVLPSYANEGVPQAVMQAMAMGLPVITTRVGAIEEVVTEDETGMFVPSRNVAALAEAMLALSRDSERRKRLGAGGRRVAEQRFSIERMVERMEAVFKEAVA